VKETHRRSAGVFVLGVVAALVMGLGWALSSPVASGPDDDYHLGSIWCPRPVGESCSLRIVDGEEQVEVPRGVSPLAMQCFVKQKDAPAACGQVDAQTVVASPRYDTGNLPRRATTASTTFLWGRTLNAPFLSCAVSMSLSQLVSSLASRL